MRALPDDFDGFEKPYEHSEAGVLSLETDGLLVAVFLPPKPILVELTDTEFVKIREALLLAPLHEWFETVELGLDY